MKKYDIINLLLLTADIHLFVMAAMGCRKVTIIKNYCCI